MAGTDRTVEGENMAIVGNLQLDPNYISPEHPIGRWPDSPQNDAVFFQINPGDIKWKIPTGWAAADGDDSADTDLSIGWNHDLTSAEQPELSLKLRFDDRIVRSPRKENLATDKRRQPHPCQQALQALEAMSIPIQAPLRMAVKYKHSPVQELYYIQRSRDLLQNPLEPVRVKMVPKTAENSRTRGWIGISETLEVWSASRERDVESELASKYDIDTTIFTTESETDLMILKQDFWHGPRPLILNLHITNWQCMIKDLAFDIVQLDTDGMVVAAVAEVTLVPFIAPENGNGLIGGGEVLEEAKDKGAIKKYTEYLQQPYTEYVAGRHTITSKTLGTYKPPPDPYENQGMAKGVSGRGPAGLYGMGNR